MESEFVSSPVISRSIQTRFCSAALFITGKVTIARMIEEALVLVSYGNSGVVELANGRRIECKYRRSVGRPYCGDRLGIELAGEDSSVLVSIKPRRNVFMRAGARQQKQVIAANLDQVLIVISPSPEPSRDLLERYLVAAHSLEIKPIIVLNKCELLGSGKFDEEGPLSRLDEYRELGYCVLSTSCKTQPGRIGVTGNPETQRPASWRDSQASGNPRW